MSLQRVATIIIRGNYRKPMQKKETRRSKTACFRLKSVKRFNYFLTLAAAGALAAGALAE